MDAARFVFPGLTTKMTRLYGRSQSVGALYRPTTKPPYISANADTEAAR